MFEVNMPKEIKSYKEKIVFGMTLRQLILNGTAILIAIPVYLIGKKYVSTDTLTWIIMGIAGIFGYFGYYTKNGLTAEQYISTVIRFTLQSKYRNYACKTQIESIVESQYEKKQNQLRKLCDTK